MLFRTERAMQAFADKIARRVKRTRWSVLALEGELGSGKTAFTRAFARALGVRARITSPTFVLARRYRITKSSSASHKSSVRNLWHLDVYRLRGREDLATINFHDIINDSDNIVVIEWADKIRSAVPKNAVWIKFRHHPKGRSIVMKHQP